jgi:hypothetical protein
MRVKDVPAIAALVAILPEPARDSLPALTELYGERDTVLAARASRCPPAADRGRRSTTCARWSTRSPAHRSPFRSTRRAARPRLSQRRRVLGVRRRHASAIGRGGRYDNIGGAFGRLRPATGFSLYPRQLAALRGRSAARRDPRARRDDRRCSRQIARCATPARSSSSRSKANAPSRGYGCDRAWPGEASMARPTA